MLIQNSGEGGVFVAILGTEPVILGQWTKIYHLPSHDPKVGGGGGGGGEGVRVAVFGSEAIIGSK